MCSQVLSNRLLLTARCCPCWIAGLSVSYVLCVLCYFMDIYLDHEFIWARRRAPVCCQ